METILIVEDEKKLNDLVRDYLTSLGYATFSCFDGLAAVDLMAQRNPDLIILDVMLPGIDGVEAAKRIRKASTVPIIMLTARETEADKLLGLEVGADDYMTKPFSIRELGARIRAVLRRTSGSGSPGRKLLEHGGLTLDGDKRQVTRNGVAVPLTSAQFDLLRVLMQEPGRVFTRKELIEATSGYVYEGYERTMDVHVKNLRKAVEDEPSRPVRIQTVWGVGYKFQDEP